MATQQREKFLLKEIMIEDIFKICNEDKYYSIPFIAEELSNLHNQFISNRTVSSFVEKINEGKIKLDVFFESKGNRGYKIKRKNRR